MCSGCFVAFFPLNACVCGFVVSICYRLHTQTHTHTQRQEKEVAAVSLSEGMYVCVCVCLSCLLMCSSVCVVSLLAGVCADKCWVRVVANS